MDTYLLLNAFDVSLGVHRGHCILLKNMSNSNTTQETLEIMKESEKKLVEESVNKNKFISKTPSKEEIEKECEDTSLRQETQVTIGNALYAHFFFSFRDRVTQLCLLPSLECSGTIRAHCTLKLLHQEILPHQPPK